MKLMKHITIALVLCAIPAMAFGQVADCEDCDHQLSVYRSGGLVATAADDAEMVNYRATCNNVTRTGQMTPNDDGVVNKLLTGELACDDEDGTFELGPITDGGWFYIHVGDNSAVGNIVAKDILMNATVEVTDAGDSITMVEGDGAVLLTHTESGRTGLLPTILPEPPTAALRKCGFKGAATAASPASPVNTECSLGDGGTLLLMTSTNAITGATVHIANKGSVYRPGGDGMVEIEADLWGNGSGHYVTTHDADTANGISAMRGQQAVAMTPARAGTRYTGVTYGVTLSTGGPGAGTTIETGTPQGGVGWSEAANLLTITVEADTAYCSKDNNHSATVNVTALMITDTDANQVTPSITRNAASGAVGAASFTVMCPAASANQGQELVPENPFPTE